MSADKATDKAAEWVQADEGLIEVYANLIHLTWSIDDVRIRYAQLVNSPRTPNPGPSLIGVAEERAAVTVPWRIAKLLRDQLSKIIEAHETQNGPIKLDQKLVPSPI